MATLVILLAGCAATPGAETTKKKNDSVTAAPGEAPLDFGEDWDSIGITWMPSAEGATLDGAAPAGATAAPPSRAPRAGAWRIVLQTFTGESHAEAAAALRSRLHLVSPRLGTAEVSSTGRGSMVVWGRYAGRDDPQGREDLDWVKSLVLNGQRVFPRVMFSKVGADPGAESRYALVGVRRQYPNVDPLYTLEVGVWGSFDGAMAWDEARRRAEAEVEELRTQGLSAYVHHDADREISSVTVGLFDHTAIDPRSGLLSIEVEELLARFPVHHVNGEPVRVPLDRRNPSRGTTVQRSMLVEVPR